MPYKPNKEMENKMSPSEKRPDFTETTEFKAAVAMAAAEAAERVKAELLGVMNNQIVEGAGQHSSSPDFESLFRQMAMSIAEISDQGTDRKRVSPEILAFRENARKRMVELVGKAKADGKIPVYKLKAKVYLDEVLVDPIWVDSHKNQRQTEIEWPDYPNEAMTPVNEVAVEIMQAFLDSIGSVEIPADRLDNRGYAVTAKGLVVRGGGGQPAKMMGDPAKAEGYQGMRITGRGEPGVLVETNVLGTVAAPARQMA